MELPEIFKNAFSKIIAKKMPELLPKAIQALKEQGIKKAAVFYNLESDDPEEQKIMVVIDKGGEEPEKKYYKVTDLFNELFTNTLGEGKK